MNNFDKFLAENDTENKLVKNASINELTCIVIRNIHNIHDEAKRKIASLSEFQKKIGASGDDENNPAIMIAMHDYLVQIHRYYEGLRFDIDNIEKTLTVMDCVRSVLNRQDYERTKRNLHVLEKTVESILHREPGTNLDYWIEYLKNKLNQSSNVN